MSAHVPSGLGSRIAARQQVEGKVGEAAEKAADKPQQKSDLLRPDVRRRGPPTAPAG